ncbi:MAG: hypothetical protein L0323_04095 [Planctomycetes bacterium]|nr:hypothetical protein [Planctomycetota bacterium]
MIEQFRFRQFAPTDLERKHLELGARTLAERVAAFPTKQLHVDVEGHPRHENFHLKATLLLPQHQVFTGETDHRLNFIRAWRKCLKKIERKLEAYRQRLGGEDRGRMVRAAGAPHVAADAAGELARARARGDFLAFTQALDDLRPEVVCHVQRVESSSTAEKLPEDEVVDGAFVLAFERFDARPPNEGLLDWIRSLVSEALRDLRAHREALLAKLESLRVPQEGAEGGTEAPPLRRGPLAPPVPGGRP